MPSTVEFEFKRGKSPEALASQLEDFRDAAGKHLKAELEKAALKIEAAAKRLAPVDSGRLRGSISSEVEQTGTITTAHIGTNVEYAVHVERGRGPIEADPGEVLHFTVDGEEVFTKRVGPAEASPFLAPAVEQNLSTVEEHIAQAIDNAAREVM